MAASPSPIESSATTPQNHARTQRYRNSLAVIERDRETLVRSLKSAYDQASARSALLDAQIHKALERDFRRRAFLIGEVILALPTKNDFAYTVMALLDRDLTRPEDRKLFFPDDPDPIPRPTTRSMPSPPPSNMKGSSRAENSAL